jgi:hypothetical protein
MSPLNSLCSFASAPAAIMSSNRECAKLEAWEPAFVCTICWQDRPTGTKPKLLGTSARIVCHGCWSAVLDLSICWVCGEYIVRGDEVVSLGWCFWHRSCFGCLFCKTSMPVPHVENWEDGIPIGTRNDANPIAGNTKPKCTGLELDEVPLCNVCMVEIAGETADHVLKKGLEIVTRSDGGLSRDRLGMLDGFKVEADRGILPATSHSPLLHRRLRDSQVKDIERDLVEFINSDSTDLGTPVHTTKNFQVPPIDGTHLADGSDGEAFSPDNTTEIRNLPKDDGMGKHQDTHYSPQGEAGADIRHPHPEPTQGEEDSCKDAYFSILNPLGEPAFRSSKTKPLPKWMRLLPSNIHLQPEKQQGIAQSTFSDTTKSTHEMQMIAPDILASSEIFENLPAGTKKASLHATSPIPKGSIISETVTRPASIQTALLKPSPKIRFNITNIETPEDAPEILLRKPLTPFPSMSRPALDRHETSSYFNHSMVIQQQLITAHQSMKIQDEGVPPTPPRSLKMGTEASPEFIKRTQSDFRLPTTFSHSSEYLDRYRPDVAEKSWYTKYVPKEPKPILEKIRRQRNAQRKLDPKTADNASQDHDVDDNKTRDGSDRQSERLRGGVDSRSKLHQELRNLFCED